MAAPATDRAKFQQALVERSKQEGNALYRQGNYEEAALKYTEALRFDDGAHVLYSNRALMRIKQQRYDEAVEDCTRAIEREPTFTKGA